MELRTYRAESLQAALALVRNDLGLDAAVLYTRARESRLPRWLGGQRQVEVVASRDAEVPSRLPPTLQVAPTASGDGQFKARLARTAQGGIELARVADSAERADIAALLRLGWSHGAAEQFLAQIGEHERRT